VLQGAHIGLKKLHITGAANCNNKTAVVEIATKAAACRELVKVLCRDISF
jgi:hypothetical protein